MTRNYRHGLEAEAHASANGVWDKGSAGGYAANEFEDALIGKLMSLDRIGAKV